MMDDCEWSAFFSVKKEDLEWWSRVGWMMLLALNLLHTFLFFRKFRSWLHVLKNPGIEKVPSVCPWRCLTFQCVLVRFEHKEKKWRGGVNPILRITRNIHNTVDVEQLVFLYICNWRRNDLRFDRVRSAETHEYIRSFWCWKWKKERKKRRMLWKVEWNLKSCQGKELRCGEWGGKKEITKGFGIACFEVLRMLLDLEDWEGGISSKWKEWAVKRMCRERS